MIDEGAVQVNGYAVKPSQKLQPGDQVSLAVLPPKPLGLAPQWMPLKLAYQDDHIVVVDKPAGLAVHPGPGHPDRTLVNALLAWCPGIEGIGGEVRPGIVHRLDRETSGLLMVAKDDVAHRGLAAQLEARTVIRRYIAMVWGQPESEHGRIEAAIGRCRKDRRRMTVVDTGGRTAATRYEVKAFHGFASTLDLRLETGRTHQIRVHLAHIGHPVFGDATYGGGAKRIRGISPLLRNAARTVLNLANRQMLHAGTLGFTHPVTGEALVFHADVPQDMHSVSEALSAGEY
jgi:23S rRNA pseudouridine1911/1915/1917 synthase